MSFEAFRVTPGTSVDLASWPTRSDVGWDRGKEEGKRRVEVLAARLAELQELFYADGGHRLLADRKSVV